MENTNSEPPIETASASDPSTAPRQDWRKRTAKLLLLIAACFLAVYASERWQSTSVEATVVHHFVGGEAYLPTNVEVMVWEDDILHADATFYTPESIASLEHTILVPPGDYRVTYSLFRDFGHNLATFERELIVNGDGRYFLQYESEENHRP